MLSTAIMANTTTVVDIMLQRNVNREVSELVPLAGEGCQQIGRVIFTDVKPANDLVK
jgi:hypothetical protein